MKRKVKKFAGDEGSVVYREEDEGLGGSKIKYREDEDGRKYTAGKANPFDRNPQEQRYYSTDDIKGKLSGLFGGGRDESKFKDLESVGGDGRRARTIEEQIGRKAEPKAEPKAETKVDFSKFDTKSYTDKPEGGGHISTTGPKTSGGGGRSNAPKKEKREVDAPKKNVGEDAKPLPGVSKDKDKPKNLPGKSESKSKPTPYSVSTKISDEEKAAIKKRAEQDDEDQEKLRKQLEKNKKEAAAPDKKKEEKKYGIGPYNAFAGIHKALSGTFSARSESQADRVAAAKAKKKEEGKKAGGSIKMAKGGSASSRGDGIAQRGKTRGKVC